MKRIFALFTALIILSCSVLCTTAKETPSTHTVITIEYLENGDYIETILTWEDSNARVTKPASKTVKYTNSSGTLLWSLTLTATFSYNGTTATCTSAYHSETAYYSYVTIISGSASKSGNKAIANASASATNSAGTNVYSLSATITCSPDGTFS